MALLFFTIHITHGVCEDTPEESHHEGHVEDNGFFKQAVAAICHQCREQLGKYSEIRQFTAKKQMFTNIQGDQNRKNNKYSESNHTCAD